LYYALANPDAQYRPGEKVLVSLPLSGPTESLTVPNSAIVRDYHGGTWVYELVEGKPRTFRRRRIEVQRLAGDDAVLSFGPTPGTSVVTGGAVELFGTELGFGTQIKGAAVDDDD